MHTIAYRVMGFTWKQQFSGGFNHTTDQCSYNTACLSDRQNQEFEHQLQLFKTANVQKYSPIHAV